MQRQLDTAETASQNFTFEKRQLLQQIERLEESLTEAKAAASGVQKLKVDSGLDEDAKRRLSMSVNPM